MCAVNKRMAVKPILKWAGGKSQLISQLLPHVPERFGTYIEPFVGGGAMFFALQPDRAVLSDSNPELVNLYRQIATKVESVIGYLKRYHNTAEAYYEVRSQKWQELPPPKAAARTIFLNRTCFNGLYRVNRKGEFNVPYGRYANPRICDEENLRAASQVLKRAEILCGDFAEVLEARAKSGDFVFLDPPYLPVGKWGDFKRYTKEQFYEADHRRLAEAIMRLRQRGVWSVLTNSNHPLVRELYSDCSLGVVKTKRNISSDASTRVGEDVIVDIPPIKKMDAVLYRNIAIPAQAKSYPPTRFMGSKRKLLSEICRVASQFQFESALDLFSGSGVVGYLFKSMGKSVICNDYMAMSATFSKAMVENSSTRLTDADVAKLLRSPKRCDDFVSTTFKGIFFTDAENAAIDALRTNIAHMKDQYKRAVAMTALIRTCAKKRPRGLFTYIGERYDDGRRDLRLPIEDLFVECIKSVNAAVFDNGRINLSRWGDALSLRNIAPDLVYIDPPYYTPKSDNEYVRRYHFLEGLARAWDGVEIQQETKTKKFKSYPTPFSTKDGAEGALDALFARYRDSVLIVSYSSNSLPTKEKMILLMSRYKENVEVLPIDYRYNFGNRSGSELARQNVREFLFVGY